MYAPTATAKAEKNVAWSNSKIFRQYLADVLDNTTAMDWATDASVKAALFDNELPPTTTSPLPTPPTRPGSGCPPAMRCPTAPSGRSRV